MGAVFGDQVRITAGHEIKHKAELSNLVTSDVDMIHMLVLHCMLLQSARSIRLATRSVPVNHIRSPN